MSEALNFDQTENLVLHYLANSSEDKSAREIQEALNVNMVMVTRALMSAKNRKPALVDLKDGRYRFIGIKDALDPLPSEYAFLSNEMDNNDDQGQDAESSNDGLGTQIDADSLGPVDQQVLEMLTVKKKVPLSGIIRQFKLEDDEAGSILDDLESKGLLTKEHIGDFDEDCFSISPEGRDVVERSFEEPSESNVYPIAKKPSKEGTNNPEKSTAAPQEAPMAGSQRKFKIPSFDNIPEENASSRGRPTGDRDYENLRVCMLGYIEEHQPCAKSNISRTLARLLSNFGRQTIIEEVDALVEAGFVHAEMSGKREVFSLTETGANAVSQVRAGNAIGPIIGGGTGSKPASAQTKKTASAAKAKPTAQKPTPAPEASAQPAPAPAAAPTAQAKPAPAPAPAAQAPQSSFTSAAAARPADESGIGGRIHELLSNFSGESAYQLRYCVDQLLERVDHLERSNDYLKQANKDLIDKI